jgi:hypothetical protein
VTIYSALMYVLTMSGSIVHYLVWLCGAQGQFYLTKVKSCLDNARFN